MILSSILLIMKYQYYLIWRNSSCIHGPCSFVWWHTSAPNMQDNLCQHIYVNMRFIHVHMRLIYFTCNIIMLTRRIINLHVDINYLHVNLHVFMLHVDIHDSHINIIMLYVEIILLHVRGRLCHHTCHKWDSVIFIGHEILSYLLARKMKRGNHLWNI